MPSRIILQLSVLLGRLEPAPPCTKPRVGLLLVLSTLVLPPGLGSWINDQPHCDTWCSLEEIASSSEALTSYSVSAATDDDAASHAETHTGKALAPWPTMRALERPVPEDAFPRTSKLLHGWCDRALNGCGALSKYLRDFTAGRLKVKHGRCRDLLP